MFVYLHISLRTFRVFPIPPLKNNIISYSYGHHAWKMLLFYLKTSKMKKVFAIALLVITLGAAFASCTSSRGGCKATQGMVGYK